MNLINAPSGAQASSDRPAFRKWSHYLADESRPIPGYIAERHPLDLRPPDYSLTVDAEQFTSREFQGLEKEKLWNKVWQIACRENDVPTPGDFVEYEICGQSILIVRDRKNVVRAFRNACRHRGTALVSGQGNVSCFSCPYHGWTYSLDGALRHIPAEWDFPHVDKARHGLIPCLAECFHGWVFINLDVGAAPLKHFLGDALVGQLDQRPLQRMWKHYHLGSVLPCNWKIMAHTFMEGYHISRTHPQIAAFVGDVQGEFDFLGLHIRANTPGGVPSLIGGQEYTAQEILESSIAFNTGRFGDAGVEIDGSPGTQAAPQVPEGHTARQVMAEMVREQMASSGLDLSKVTDAEILDPITYTIFPNMALLNHAPGQLNFRFRPHGDDPNYCLFEILALKAVPEHEPLPRDVPMVLKRPEEKLADYAGKIGAAGALLDQDVHNATLEQKGLNSGVGQIVLGRTMEASIIYFHHTLNAWMGIG